MEITKVIAAMPAAEEQEQAQEQDEGVTAALPALGELVEEDVADDSFPHAEGENDAHAPELAELAAAAADDTRASLVEEDLSMEMTKMLPAAEAEQAAEPENDNEPMNHTPGDNLIGRLSNADAMPGAAAPRLTVDARQVLGDKTFAFVYGNGARPTGVPPITSVPELNLTETFNSSHLGLAPLRSPDADGPPGTGGRPSVARPSLALSPGAAELIRTRALDMVRRSMGGAAAGRPSLLSTRRSSGVPARRSSGLLAARTTPAAPIESTAEMDDMVTPVDAANGDNALTGASLELPGSAELFAAAQQAAEAVDADGVPTPMEANEAPPAETTDMMMAPLASPGGATGTFVEFCRIADVSFLEARRASSFGGVASLPSPSAPATLREAMHLLCLSAPAAEALEAQRDALEMIAGERKGECRELEGAFARGEIGAELASQLANADGEELAGLQGHLQALKDKCRAESKLEWKLARHSQVVEEQNRLQSHVQLLEADLLSVQQDLIAVQRLSIDAQAHREAKQAERAAREAEKQRKENAKAAKQARMARLAELQAANAARCETLAQERAASEAAAAAVAALEAERQAAVAATPGKLEAKAATPAKAAIRAKVAKATRERLRALEDVQILERLLGWDIVHVDDEAVHIDVRGQSVAVPLAGADADAEAVLAKARTAICAAQRRAEALDAANRANSRKLPWLHRCDPVRTANGGLHLHLVAGSLDTLCRVDAVVDISHFPVEVPRLVGTPSCLGVSSAAVASAAAASGLGPRQVERLVRQFGHAVAGI